VKGWSSDGERIDLSPWQEEEVRRYMAWRDDKSPGSRFMFSSRARQEGKTAVITTINRMNEHKTKTGNWFPEEKNMRRFRVYRPNPPEEYRESGTANAPDEVQFEGVVFSDGTVCVRWLTEFRSHSLWNSLEDLEKVHGHPEYGSIWGWLDD